MPRLCELWQLYGDLLWEPSPHKDTCRSYIEEASEVLARADRDILQPESLDLLTAFYRNRSNRNSTINRKFSAISKLLRKHYRNGEISRMPDIRKLPERNARVRFLTYREEVRIVDELNNVNPAYGALATFLVNTGARIGEALNLAWGDIHDGRVTFWETKSGKPRTIPLALQASESIRFQQANSARRGPFSSIQYRKFRTAWIQAKAAAGLSGDDQVVPHILRHTCASRLAQRGVDIKRIQEFLGHRTLAMTLRYAHLAPKHLDICAVELNAFQQEHASCL